MYKYFNTKKDLFSAVLKTTSILSLFFLFLISSEKANAAKIYFNDVYKGTGNNYAEQTNSITNIQFITGSGFTFTSADPADVTFKLTGNNVAGNLTYLDAAGVKQTITGQVSRQDKNGNTTIGLYFYTTTNEAYLLVIPGVTSYSSNTNISTSSDPILAVMNAVLSAQNSQPKITVNDVTVNNTDPYAVFTVSLSSAANANSTFTPSLTGVTATLNTDFTSSMQYFNGSSWVNISSSVTIAQGATSIQIRVPILNAGALTARTFNLNTGTVSGSNVLNSDGAYGVGTILPTPTITTNGALKIFASCSGCSVNPQSFTVSGSNLTSDIVLTAPTGLQLSTSASSGFATSITLTQNANTVTTTTVYAKLTNNATTASSGVISITSTNAISKTITVTTNTDNALNFDGVNDYVNITSSAFASAYSNTSVTIEAWIKTTSTANVNEIIGWGSTSAINNVVEFRTSNGQLQFILNDGTRFYSYTSASYVNTGKWVHVAIVKSGTTVSLYINGQNVAATAAGNIASAPTVNAANIGLLAYRGVSTAYGPIAGSYFNGSIDQLRVWNTAKSSADIAANMFVGMGGTETGLIASYDFNQGFANDNGNVNNVANLNDNSTNAYNGTFSGFTLTGTSSNFVAGFIPDITAAGNVTSITSGSTLQLSNSLTGGVWASSSTSIASVNSAGLVTGVASGSVTLTYTICDKVVSYSLTVVQPTLTTSGTLKTFTSCSGCSINPQSFSISGSDLGANVTVTAPTGFVISTTATGTYVTSLTYTPTSGTLTTTSVFAKLSNSATSATSGNFTITSTGATSKTVTATVNTDNALNFDGVNDAINIGQPIGAGSSYTIEAWVKYDGSTGPLNIVSSNKNVFYISSNKLTAGVNGPSGSGGGSWAHVQNSNNLPANKWTHVAVTFNDPTKTITLYENGVQVATASSSSSSLTFDTNEPFYIGSHSNNSSLNYSPVSFFKGNIDEVRLWNTVLDAATIQSNMYKELAGSEAGLKAYYNFNQGTIGGSNTSISTLNGLTSPAYNGTMSGFTLTTGTTSNFVAGVIPDITALGNATTVVQGNTLQLSNGLTGGVWSSSNSNIATIDASTGLVTGVAAGNVTLSYTICNKTVSYSLTVVTPTLTTSSLKTFTSCSGCTITPQSFTVAGSNLGANAVITAPTGFEISTSQGGSYSSTITLTPSAGTIATTSIYVRLINSATTATSGSITVASTGATSKTITTTVNTDNALNFDGVNDIVKTASNISALNITGDITIETWIRLSQMPTDWVRLIGKGSPTERTYGLWTYSDGSILFQRFTSSGVQNLQTSSSIIEVGKWYHVAVAKIGSNVKIYINGTEVATSSAYSATPYSSTQPLEIGGTTSIHQLLNGSLDDIRIWNIGRSSSEIANSYLKELTGTESGLVAYYNFNQGTTNGTNSSILNLTDRTSNAFDGTITNFALSGSSSNFVGGFIPEISGAAVVQNGGTSNYTDGLTGGVWSSLATGVATIDPTTGIVTGVSAGNSTITYTICNKTVSKLITVVDPTITTTGSLTAFSTCATTNSTAQTFTASAQYLTANLILTAPAGYELSLTSGGTYTSTLSIAPSAGTVAATTIYVRTTNTIVNGQSGNINITSTGATTKTVATGNAVVTQNLTASVTISSNATNNTFCSGTNVTFTATPTNGGNTPTYQWKKNGVSISGATSATYSSTTLTNNDLITVVMGSNIANCISGSPATSNGITVTVNTIPNVPGSITGPTTICMNSNQVYSVAAVTGATAYTWLVTGNLTATASTNNVINITAGNTSGAGTIQVLASNACGSSAYSAILNVNVNNTPAPTASFTTNVIGSICIGAPAVTFTNTSTVNATTLSPITSYAWDFGDGSSTVTTTNASNTYSASGTYDAILTITDANACTSSVANRIVVDPISIPGTATATNSTICSGSNTTINLTGNLGTVQWMSAPSGTNNFNNIIGATSNVLNTGTLTSSTDFIAVVKSGSCSVATTSIITVNVSAIPSLTLGAVGNLYSNATSFDLPYSNTVGNPFTYSVVTTSPNVMPNFVPISNYGLLASPITIAIPASASGNYNFNLTLSNALGCSSAVIPFTITVAVQAPSSLNYTTPNVYTVGNTIAALNPSSTGGSITSYTISPNLPAGLTINPTTGIISGTPSAVSSQTSYTVTGTNASGTVTATVVITVNVAPPAGLNYNTPNVYPVGSPITSLNPNSTGGPITQYSIGPSLPAGLTIDPTTGIISGTPSAVSSQTAYTVTGTNASGTVTATVVITVNVAAPAGLSYNTPNVYPVGSPITSLNPSSTGGPITQYSIGPSLPAGLTINPTTGVISGTPSAVSTQTSYTVTGTNASGTVTATVVITVNGLPPLSLSYTTPNVYNRGTAISPLNPTSTGGALTQYTIAPNLPSGLTINPSSGIISGTPSVASTQTTYTVTGFNAYGTISTTVVITVNNSVQPPAPPPAFSGRYIQGNPSIPSNLNALKTNLPTGVVPVWCAIGTLNCSTTAPTLPTAIGRYVYQVRSYDTANQLYSSTFVNDTIIIAPPAPVVKDSTYVVGVLTNPSNIGVQVTGLTGATFNYFYLTNPQTGIPALGSTIGTKRYTVSQTVNSIESDTSGFNVTLLDPNSIIHLQKLVDTSVLQSNSTFNYQFRFIVTNLTNTPFSNVVIKDNLQNSVPLTSEFSIISKSATGNLVANTGFNGSSDVNLTTEASALSPNGRDSAKFIMNLVPRGYNGNLTNIAYVSANTKWGVITMQSSAGSSSNPSVKSPTVYEVKDIYISIPEGFSPNHDGVNDNFVIIKPYNVTLDLEIFNRWGNVVYSNRNYNNDWDGRGTGNFVGQDLIEGGYYYAIKAVDDRGNMKLFKGYIIIQR